MVGNHERTAMILAAGRGTRMGELGEKYPKALLKVNGTPLIQYHIDKLREAGFSRIVINVSHLATQIKQFIANQHNLGLDIVISEEKTPLETAGGIASALKYIKRDIFPVINADIYSELPFQRLAEATHTLKINSERTGYLFMVPNPEHNLDGDFHLADKSLTSDGEKKLTFSGIGIYRASIFTGICENTSIALAPILNCEIKRNRMLGELVTEFWSDAGTPERLEQIDRIVSARNQ